MRHSLLALLVLGLAAPLAAQTDSTPADTGRFRFHFAYQFVFSPDQVIRHQRQLGISDVQRKAMQAEIRRIQDQFATGQWELSAANEKLASLLRPERIDEAAAMAAVDQVLKREFELKRSQMLLLIRMKNTLTPVQQHTLERLQEDKP